MKGRCEEGMEMAQLKLRCILLMSMFLAKFAMGEIQQRHLDVHFKGKNIADILNMPCEEALGFFENQPAIVRHMQTLVDVVGVVRFGQPAPTLQVVKLNCGNSQANSPNDPPGIQCTFLMNQQLVYILKM